MDQPVEGAGAVFANPVIDEGFRQQCLAVGGEGWKLVSLVTLQRHHGISRRLIAAFRLPLTGP